MQHTEIGVHTFLLVAAILLFLGAASWITEPWPWRSRLIALGLFCWSLSTIINF